jgi:hypothetical protein
MVDKDLLLGKMGLTFLLEMFILIMKVEAPKI